MTNKIFVLVGFLSTPLIVSLCDPAYARVSPGQDDVAKEVSPAISLRAVTNLVNRLHAADEPIADTVDKIFNKIGDVNNPTCWNHLVKSELKSEMNQQSMKNFVAASQIYSPQNIRSAYNLDINSMGDGTGQTIAIIDAYGSSQIQESLDKFSEAFSLDSAHGYNTYVDVLYAQGSASDDPAGWGIETELDVEWAHAIAPGAKILLIVTNEPTTRAFMAAVDLAVKAGANVISMSWGTYDLFPQELKWDHHFADAVSHGVTLFASSGDDGAMTYWPSVSPSVTAVGGTSLYLTGGPAPIFKGPLPAGPFPGSRPKSKFAEQFWGYSSGGFSDIEPAPSYQKQTAGEAVYTRGADGKLLWPGLPPSDFVSATYPRVSPDVSYNADPNTGFPIYDGPTQSWFFVGGTSAGAPQWAAIASIINQRRASNGLGPLGSLNKKLYAAYDLRATSNHYQTSFFDILTGFETAIYMYALPADVLPNLPGYDLITGLGSPKVGNLISVLGAK